MQGVLVLFLKTTKNRIGEISKSDREIPQLSGVFQRMDAEDKPGTKVETSTRIILTC